VRFGYPIGNGANCGAIVPELQVKSAVGQLTSKQIGEKSGFNSDLGNFWGHKIITFVKNIGVALLMGDPIFLQKRSELT
jgi:hypothetical protein